MILIQIEKGIFDYYDDKKLGEVFFKPFFNIFFVEYHEEIFDLAQYGRWLLDQIN